MAGQVHAGSSAAAALILGLAAGTAWADACPTAAGPVRPGQRAVERLGRTLDNARYQPEPAIRASDVSKLALKWAFGHPNGTEFGQPTLVDERLFVASSAGRVYSLDAKTGCSYWTYDAAAGSRTAVIIGELARKRVVALPRRLKRTLAHLDVIKAPSAAFFGDDSGAVYALDAQKGTLLWKTQVDSHPLARIVGTPVLYEDRLYVTVSSTEDAAAANSSYGCCTFRGSVASLDIATGKMAGRATPCSREPQPTHRNSAGTQEFGPAGAAIFLIAHRRWDAPCPVRCHRRFGERPGTIADGCRRPPSTSRTGSCAGSSNWRCRMPERAAPASRVPRYCARWRAAMKFYLRDRSQAWCTALDPDHGGEILWQTRIGDPGGPGAAGAAGGQGPVAMSAGVAGHPGGVAWGSAADHRNLYVAVSGALAQPPNSSGSLTALDMKTGVARWHRAAPEPPCAWGEHNCSHGLAQARHRHAGQRILRIDGRAPACLFDHRRQDTVGLRHGKRISNQERRQGGRRAPGSRRPQPS